MRVAQEAQHHLGGGLPAAHVQCGQEAPHADLDAPAGARSRVPLPPRTTRRNALREFRLHIVLVLSCNMRCIQQGLQRSGGAGGCARGGALYVQIVAPREPHAHGRLDAHDVLVLAVQHRARLALLKNNLHTACVRQGLRSIRDPNLQPSHHTTSCELWPCPSTRTMPQRL